jgi:hypothetical protein
MRAVFRYAVTAFFGLLTTLVAPHTAFGQEAVPRIPNPDNEGQVDRLILEPTYGESSLAMTAREVSARFQAYFADWYAGALRLSRLSEQPSRA